MTGERQYVAIDLKSFYASVECVERGLDPLDACLVVADLSRTEKTICLAVSPALKAFGTGGRPRLFEVSQRIREVNRSRGAMAYSRSGRELAANPRLGVDYWVATPRMALYMDYSRRVYEVYLRYVAPEDVHVYSVDEVFIDVTPYLMMYRMTAHQLAMRMIRDVLATTGVTATAGVGTNMYLCKVAMDIVAKRMKPDADGVRIAELDELSYRRLLWSHTPLTDFWRVGRGTARRLETYGIKTMGDVARRSLTDEPLLRRLFGVNAELLIDHAWGYEPVTMAEVKRYRPQTHSLSAGQVLSRPYPADQARTVMLEMIDTLALKLLKHHLVSDQLTLTISYDHTALTDRKVAEGYKGAVTVDHYGRAIPVHSHGTARAEAPTSSTRILSMLAASLYDRIVNVSLSVRRLSLCLGHVAPEETVPRPQAIQLELWVDYDLLREEEARSRLRARRERYRQEAVLDIKTRHGKNAILRGLNYADGATQRERNTQIGGHRS